MRRAGLPVRVALSCVLAALVAAAPAAAEAERERRAMVAEVIAMARETGFETGRERLAPTVLAAMTRVPRHRFVPSAARAVAYANRPLPIGHGQTISQPYIVALMTDLLRVSPGDTVLEIGTGSGYQAAILAELAGGRTLRRHRGDRRRQPRTAAPGQAAQARRTDGDPGGGTLSDAAVDGGGEIP